MTYGTAYFVSQAEAVNYYKPYGYDSYQVYMKLMEGEIHVGKPPLQPGDKLSVIRDEGRYQITSVMITLP